MPEPSDDLDPFTNAPTLPRQGQRRSDEDETDRALRRKGAWTASFDQTLIRGGSDARAPREDVELSGVTPEVDGRYLSSGAELGRGGIGRVTIAFDCHLGREVAIKELLPAAYPHGPDDSTGDLARFLREARITGQLEHPSIVPVYELGQRDDGRLYYSMKLVRGRTLRKALDSAGSFVERMTLIRHFVDLANAIAYAHSRGVVHRDIKPENVMLGEFGETVVLDWGLAKLKVPPDADVTEDDLAAADPTDSESRQLNVSDAPNTVAGEVVGTPAYMSPEQAEGQSGAVDERSDVWSLGAVLFEILSGKPPFHGKTVENLLFQVITADFEPIRSSVEDAPADLSAIAEKALSKNPARRYPNAGALVDDVNAFLNGRQVAAYDYSAWDLIKKFVRENQTTALASLVVTLTVIAGVIGTLAAYQRAVFERGRAKAAQTAEASARRLAERNERRAHDNLSMALAEKARLIRDDHLDFTAAGVYAAAALFNSPFVDTSPFRHPDLGERAGEANGKVLPLRSALFDLQVHRHLRVATALPTGGKVACAFAVTPSGKRLVTTDADGQFAVWDLDARRRLSVVDGPACPRRLDVDPDARRAVLLAQNTRAFVIDLADGTRRPLDLPERRLRAITFSPDGGSIYVAGAAKTVVRIDAETLETEAQSEVRAPRSIRLDGDGRRLAVGTRWGEVEVLDAASLQRQQRFKDHGSAVWALSFSPDGRRLATGGFEGQVIVRDLQPNMVIARLGEETPIYGLDFSADGVHLLAGGFERGHLWHVDQQALLQTFRIYPRGVQHLAVRPGHREVFTAGYGPDVHVWQLTSAEATRFVGHAARIYGFASRADGARFATSDQQHQIRVWSAEPPRQYWTVKEPSVWALAYMGDELLSIASHGRVARWASADDPVILQPPLAGRHGSNVDIDATDGLAAWTGEGTEIVVFDAAKGRVQARLSELARQSTAVALGPKGKRLAAADEGGTVVVWSLGDRWVQWRHEAAHRGIVTGLDFSADGQRLASSGQDGVIRLWDANDGRTVATLEGHGDWVNRIEFSRDGQWLASASDDRTFRLWSIADRRAVIAITAESQVNAAGFLGDQRRMAIGRDSELMVVPMVIPALDRPVPEVFKEAQRSAGLSLVGFDLQPTPTPPSTLE